MISFRYHLVSIVAVFLALAVGAVMGTTVIKQGLVDSLRSQTDRQIRANHALEQEVAQLQAENRQWTGFVGDVEPTLLSGQLAGTDVVIVTQDGVDLGLVDGIRSVLREAGATVVAVLKATRRMALSDGGSRADLAGLLGQAPTDAPEALAQEAARRLATRLADGRASDGTDLIDEMVHGNGAAGGGFLTVQPGSGTAGSQEIGGTNQPVIVLSGGRQQPELETSLFLEPLVDQMVKDLHTVVAVEPSTTVYPFVPTLRTDPAVDGHIVTVDDGEKVFGHVALVLGLRDMLARPGQGGDYGLRSDASDGLTPIPSPP